MDRFTLGFACGACVFAAAVCGIAALALVDLWRVGAVRRTCLRVGDSS